MLLSPEVLSFVGHPEQSVRNLKFHSFVTFLFLRIKFPFSYM